MATKPAVDVPVLIFARTPVPGSVKTRLIPAIGPERAANLHRAMLWRTVETVVDAGIGPVELWCAPAVAHPFIEKIRNAFGVGLHLQEGADLGARMHHALSARLDPPGAVLVGTDCPFLEARDLVSAARVLAAGADAVIGPAEDGGYYLIGVRESVAGIYADVSWGSGEVLSITRRNLRDLGWRWEELATRRDVDRPEDLKGLEGILIY